MINEEYSFDDLKDFLLDAVDLLIVGWPNQEERSCFFYGKWYNTDTKILLVKREKNEKVHCKLLENKTTVFERNVDLCVGLPQLLNCLNINQKNVLIDLSSLDNVLIMFLTKQLLTRVAPKSLFASYIRPEKYSSQSGDVGFALSEQVSAIESVPGFTRRESDNQTLCTFLGFEGKRLKGILETIHGFEKLVPIVAFPSGTPQWYNVTMWNSMDILQSETKDLLVYKCYSESVFDAVRLLNETIAQDENVVLAPLGTRPHSMACAIFACQHQATRIIYDFVIESEHRAIGVSDITIYHLSSFIKC